MGGCLVSHCKSETGLQSDYTWCCFFILQRPKRLHPAAGRASGPASLWSNSDVALTQEFAYTGPQWTDGHAFIIGSPLLGKLMSADLVRHMLAHSGAIKILLTDSEYRAACREKKESLRGLMDPRKQSAVKCTGSGHAVGPGTSPDHGPRVQRCRVNKKKPEKKKEKTWSSRGSGQETSRGSD